MLASESQTAQSLTKQVVHCPLMSPKPWMHELQSPMKLQVAQLVTPQLVHSVVLERKKPELQLTHSLAALQLSQLATSQGSQLVDPAVFRLNPGEQASQVSAPLLQLKQLAMLQLKQEALSVARVKPSLQVPQTPLNSQVMQFSSPQATRSRRCRCRRS